MPEIQEIAVVWSWDDGTRCVLCSKDREDGLELQVVQDGRAVRSQAVTDVLVALTDTGPRLELDCMAKKMRAG
jgi:hypothetical protein